MNQTNEKPFLHVVKASAGSGKTWRLTLEYLTFLFEKPDAFRNLLAVTFTNKATKEMKERIINALWEISHPTPATSSDSMTTQLSQALHLSPQVLQARAEKAIKGLLHDYSHFQVETIDRFFQSVLRNLARELGIGHGLNLELDNESALNEAVDLLLDSCNENQELLQWITDFIEEAYQEGKPVRIDKILKDFGNALFEETYQVASQDLSLVLRNKSFLLIINAHC